MTVVPLWYGLRYDLPLPAFCKYICPAGTLEGSVPLLATPGNSALVGLLGWLFANKLALLIAFLLSFCFVYRPFCRFLCPLGEALPSVRRENPKWPKAPDRSSDPPQVYRH